jgi:hypothetical protein
MSNTTSNSNTGFTAIRLVIVDLKTAFHIELIHNGITKW